MHRQKLGAVQLAILKILWRRGAATAREITDCLAPEHALAHSTVQTLLRKLETKGAIQRDASARVFVFRPIWNEDETTNGAARDLLSRVFEGSLSGLVSHLLKHERVDAEELDRLRLLIDEAARNVDKKEEL